MLRPFFSASKVSCAVDRYHWFEFLDNSKFECPFILIDIPRARNIRKSNFLQIFFSRRECLHICLLNKQEQSRTQQSKCHVLQQCLMLSFLELKKTFMQRTLANPTRELLRCWSATLTLLREGGWCKFESPSIFSSILSRRKHADTQNFFWILIYMYMAYFGKISCF